MPDPKSAGDSSSEGVRRRVTGKSWETEMENEARRSTEASGDARADGHSDSDTRTKADKEPCRKLRTGTFWLTRIVILRYLGFIYFVAFLVAYHQNKQLIGPNGLLPADIYLKNVLERTRGLNFNTFSNVPSILWLFDYRNNLPMLLDCVALAGLVLSGFVIVLGAANWIIMLTLWILYHSLVNVGQRCGYRYVLTLVDMATRFPEAIPLRNIDTASVAEALLTIFSRVGFPDQIVSDNGTQFVSDLMKEIYKLLSIKSVHTSPYHAQSNGMVERFNGVLKTMLRKVVQKHPSNWERYIPALLFAYRELPNESTGFSPFELLFGRRPRGPMDILATAWSGRADSDDVKPLYGFGWESQLLETGFLATFLCPVLSLRQLPRGTPTSFVVIAGYRWLIFRIMLGAGLIKIRGDKCWRDLTCMNYHYETQPVPNPMSYYMHQSPEMWHKFETLSNHFVELVAPFLLVLPRPFCMAGGAIQILFQVVLIISGNLSFLNWLTILPNLACYDDASLSWMFSARLKRKIAQIQHEDETGTAPPLRAGNYVRRVFNISLGILLAYLSIPVVQNLLSSRQAMNTSFDSLRLVNTYGAFGSVTKKRTEVIFQGTSSRDPYSPNAVWKDYEFKCKPGNLTRRPCLISPYHYRLDWLMWFAAFQSYQHNPWLVHLAVKLLANDADATSLIAHNPFEGQNPPRFIRAEHYRYHYTKIGSSEAAKGAWWRRKYIGNYLPPISLESARPILKQMGWRMPAYS
ncbi:hypothetical protein BaRGS_00010297 [Batillaria attramentaria]|uniref:Lipase maturation factor n=1 Tax=Batillaria attramentaria TaxID=370345 RepID=A0ABD0LGI0_9CAEN